MKLKENQQESTQVAQRITSTREARQFTINSKTLSVAIKPKDKGKFKSMEEAKVALQKAL